MFKNVLTAAAATLTLGVAAQGQSVINFNVTSVNGGNPGQALDGTAATGVVGFTGTTFNDATSVNVADFLDSQGAATGISVATTSDGGNSGAGFSFSQGPGLVAGAADFIDNYLAATNGFGPDLAGDLVFTFDGLDADNSYDFHFISSGDNNDQGGSFTINGTTLTTSGVPQADAATTGLVEGVNFVSFTGITGVTTLDVNFGAGPGNVGFAALNGFQVVETVPEPASLALLGLGGLAVLGRRRRA